MKKTFIFSAVLMLTAICILPGRVNAETAKVDMYRLYNSNSGEHFYTADENEKKQLVSLGWSDEGIGWSAPQESNLPVYRLYNPNAGDHHYTMDTNERDSLIQAGWNYEGIGWYSAGEDGQIMYRLYNPNTSGAGSHHYTSNRYEAKDLIIAGWQYEGYSWYGAEATDDFSDVNQILDQIPDSASFYLSMMNPVTAREYLEEDGFPLYIAENTDTVTVLSPYVDPRLMRSDLVTLWSKCGVPSRSICLDGSYTTTWTSLAYNNARGDAITTGGYEKMFWNGSTMGYAGTALTPEEGAPYSFWCTIQYVNYQ